MNDVDNLLLIGLWNIEDPRQTGVFRRTDSQRHRRADGDRRQRVFRGCGRTAQHAHLERGFVRLSEEARAATQENRHRRAKEAVDIVVDHRISRLYVARVNARFGETAHVLP